MRLHRLGFPGEIHSTTRREHCHARRRFRSVPRVENLEVRRLMAYVTLLNRTALEGQGASLVPSGSPLFANDPPIYQIGLQSLSTGEGTGSGTPPLTSDSNGTLGRTPAVSASAGRTARRTGN